MAIIVCGGQCGLRMRGGSSNRLCCASARADICAPLLVRSLTQRPKATKCQIPNIRTNLKIRTFPIVRTGAIAALIHARNVSTDISA